MAKKAETKKDDTKVTLFDVIDEIQGKQRPWEELGELFAKAYNQFMINRMISSSKVYVHGLEFISKFRLSDKLHYEYLCSFIAQQKHYFNYTAYRNTKQEDTLGLYALEHEYEISRKDAADYYLQLTDSKHSSGTDELEKIKAKWKLHYDTFGKKSNK